MPDHEELEQLLQNREKVMRGLEWVINDIEENGNHVHAGQYLDEIKNALELLKEVKPE